MERRESQKGSSRTFLGHFKFAGNGKIVLEAIGLDESPHNTNSLVAFRNVISIRQPCDSSENECRVINFDAARELVNNNQHPNIIESVSITCYKNNERTLLFFPIND